MERRDHHTFDEYGDDYPASPTIDFENRRQPRGEVNPSHTHGYEQQTFGYRPISDTMIQRNEPSDPGLFGRSGQYTEVAGNNSSRAVAYGQATIPAGQSLTYPPSPSFESGYQNHAQRSPYGSDQRPQRISRGYSGSAPSSELGNEDYYQDYRSGNRRTGYPHQSHNRFQQQTSIGQRQGEDNSRRQLHQAAFRPGDTFVEGRLEVDNRNQFHNNFRGARYSSAVPSNQGFRQREASQGDRHRRQESRDAVNSRYSGWETVTYPTDLQLEDEQHDLSQQQPPQDTGGQPLSAFDEIWRREADAHLNSDDEVSDEEQGPIEDTGGHSVYQQQNRSFYQGSSAANPGIGSSNHQSVQSRWSPDTADNTDNGIRRPERFKRFVKDFWHAVTHLTAKPSVSDPSVRPLVDPAINVDTLVSESVAPDTPKPVPPVEFVPNIHVFGGAQGTALHPPYSESTLEKLPETYAKTAKYHEGPRPGAGPLEDRQGAADRPEFAGTVRKVTGLQKLKEVFSRKQEKRQAGHKREEASSEAYPRLADVEKQAQANTPQEHSVSQDEVSRTPRPHSFNSTPSELYNSVASDRPVTRPLDTGSNPYSTEHRAPIPPPERSRRHQLAGFTSQVESRDSNGHILGSPFGQDLRLPQSPHHEPNVQRTRRGYPQQYVTEVRRHQGQGRRRNIRGTGHVREPGSFESREVSSDIASPASLRTIHHSPRSGILPSSPPQLGSPTSQYFHTRRTTKTPQTYTTAGSDQRYSPHKTASEDQAHGQRTRQSVLFTHDFNEYLEAAVAEKNEAYEALIASCKSQEPTFEDIDRHILSEREKAAALTLASGRTVRSEYDPPAGSREEVERFEKDIARPKAAAYLRDSIVASKVKGIWEQHGDTDPEATTEVVRDVIQTSKRISRHISVRKAPKARSPQTGQQLNAGLSGSALSSIAQEASSLKSASAQRKRFDSPGTLAGDNPRAVYRTDQPSKTPAGNNRFKASEPREHRSGSQSTFGVDLKPVKKSQPSALSSTSSGILQIPRLRALNSEDKRASSGSTPEGNSHQASGDEHDSDRQRTLSNETSVIKRRGEPSQSSERTASSETQSNIRAAGIGKLRNTSVAALARKFEQNSAGDATANQAVRDQPAGARGERLPSGDVPPQRGQVHKANPSGPGSQSQAEVPAPPQRQEPDTASGDIAAPLVSSQTGTLDPAGGRTQNTPPVSRLPRPARALTPGITGRASPHTPDQRRTTGPQSSQQRPSNLPLRSNVQPGQSPVQRPSGSGRAATAPLSRLRPPDPRGPNNPVQGDVTQASFLDSCLTASVHRATMDLLSVRSIVSSTTKAKAAEDARQMQKSVEEECHKTGQEPPSYSLMELIGKGSFGRVYKGKDKASGKLVAVKIIDIDEGDLSNPRFQDTHADILKEIGALKVLSETKAKNINLVIDALPVGKSMWMVTEYCAGGSVSTLMRPTPKGLQERFIIIILREVAKAVESVHSAGIIHRDLKCANVLITEMGEVQLCDFGVAGVVEHAHDKRSTFIGTPNWMAPEMFGKSPSYGKAVDVWAFGSMAYEMASGMPPNAMSGVMGRDMGDYLKEHIPRLEGDQYSMGLRDIVASCLEENPAIRPTIEEVSNHYYIYGTSQKYPTSGLTELVRAFKHWEAAGGSRRSLFNPGGAQGPTSSSFDGVDEDLEEWNFSTTASFDQAVGAYTNDDDVRKVYGNAVDLGPLEQAAMPAQQQSTGRYAGRRRPPPGALNKIKAPIEKLFDPNTVTSYDTNSKIHYLREVPVSVPTTTSDLPLRERNEVSKNATRESMIDLGDLGDHDGAGGHFQDLTMRQDMMIRHDPIDYGFHDDDVDNHSNYDDYAGLETSGPSDNPNRRTQEWTFPSAATSAAPKRLPTTAEESRPPFRLGGNRRPSLVHAATEPPGLGFGNFNASEPASPQLTASRESLIDLDFGMLEAPSNNTAEASRPSTADSSASSVFGNPFSLESHVSNLEPYHRSLPREPSLYLPAEAASNHFRGTSGLSDLGNESDFPSGSEAEKYVDQRSGHGYHDSQTSAGNASDLDGPYTEATGQSSNDMPRMPTDGRTQRSHADASQFPPLPAPPSVAALTGTASPKEMEAELKRQLDGLVSQLEGFKALMENIKPSSNKNNKNATGRKSKTNKK